MNDITKIRSEALQRAGRREIKISNKSYSIKLLSAYMAFSVGMRIAKTILPALGALVDGSKREEYILPEEDGMFAEVAVHLVNQMDKLNITDIIAALLLDFQVNDQAVDPDDYFRGDLSGFMSVLEFAIKENFSDFFSGYLKEKGLKIHSLKQLLAKSLPEETTPQ